MSERLEILRGRYRAYLEAERAILTGQSYTIEGLTLTRANLSVVRKTIDDLALAIRLLEVKESGRKRSRVRVVIPLDRATMRQRWIY